MKAAELYKHLDNDFKLDQIGTEEWDIDSVKAYVTDSFKKRYEGIIDVGDKNILIFSHHAQSWESRKKDGEPYIHMNNLPEDTLKKMKALNISLYSLHIPLDNYSDYSTGKTFGDALGIRTDKGCCLYLNALTGVIGTAADTKVAALQKRIEQVLEHKAELYSYGSADIKKSRVGIVTGWGLDIEVLEEMSEAGINTFITGFTRKLPLNKDIMSAHRFAEEHGINIIGTTHYSSEKFACMAMAGYFKNLGIDAEFIEGNYSLYDL